MSMEDVEVVRDQFAAVNERDFPRAMAHYDEDVVLVVNRDAFLEGGTFEGRDAVGRWFGDWFSTFEPGYQLEIDEARDIDGVVLLVAHHHGRGRASGAEVQGETAYLYRFRDRKIVRVELFATRAAAAAAAGIRE